MKKSLFLLMLIVVSAFAKAQRPITIEQNKEKDGLRVYAVNTDRSDYRVIMLPNATGFKEVPKEVTVIVPAGETKDLVFLEFAGDKNNFKYRYSVEKIKASTDNVATTEYNGKSLDEGIYVFNKDGCVRCDKLTSMMSDEKVDFDIINITQQPGYNRVMWNYLKQQGYYEKGVTTPVVLVDGIAYYNIQDLNGFMKEVRSY